LLPTRDPLRLFTIPDPGVHDHRNAQHLFVATLGYSRKLYVRAFRHERQ